MIIDDLKELLKTAHPTVELITTCWKNARIDEQIASLEQQAQAPDIWSLPGGPEVLKKLQNLKDEQKIYQKLLHEYQEFPELLELFSTDPHEMEKLRIEISRWYKKLLSFKITLLLNDPQDSGPCFVSINAGAGGTESQDWADILLRMFTRFCEREELTATVVDYQAGESAGIKSATLHVTGKNAYGFLKSEHGIHRLVRISPFDANKRRHTSFVGVFVAPETPDIEVTINPEDLKIDTFRAGGAGGQHVNKTESAIRITHIPTGIVVACQTGRSQGQNKETALKMLKARLAQKQQEEQQAKIDAIEKKKIEWGSQIRSYVLHPYKMVKDHRTDYESSQPDIVLDGDLMPFIEAYLVMHTENH